MNLPLLNVALSGAIAMGYVIAGLFFLRFWRMTRDRLFGLFALAFLVLASERVVLLALATSNEFTPYVYFLRLTAFGLILIGILDKNRGRGN